MTEMASYLCNSLKAANMHLGDVCNINRKVIPSDIQSWIMLMQVWGIAIDMKPEQGIKKSRLMAHQALEGCREKMKFYKGSIRKLLL